MALKAVGNVSFSTGHEHRLDSTIDPCRFRVDSRLSSLSTFEPCPEGAVLYILASAWRCVRSIGNVKPSDRTCCRQSIQESHPIPYSHWQSGEFPANQSTLTPFNTQQMRRPDRPQPTALTTTVLSTQACCLSHRAPSGLVCETSCTVNLILKPNLPC